MLLCTHITKRSAFLLLHITFEAFDISNHKKLLLAYKKIDFLTLGFEMDHRGEDH